MIVPFVTCLCPTYQRPRLLENAIACFCEQEYPANRRALVILDDAGQIRPQHGNGWELHSRSERFASLPDKYNALAALADPATDLFAIWEDDDIYLPHHLSAHAAALSRRTGTPQRPLPLWSKPSRVLSLYTGKPEQENASGRFFASIAVTRELWRHVGGIPNTRRADFDQQFMAALLRANGPAADPLDFSPQRTPGYCFRWASTDAYHGQALMQSPEDVTWYERCQKSSPGPIDHLSPAPDAETRATTQICCQPKILF